MKLKITGIGEYDVEETLSKPSLNDLFYLKVKTRSDEYPKGVSLRSLGEGLQKLAEFTDPLDFLDDAQALLHLRALVYLCRRHVGEKVTVDSANEFGLDAFSFETEEADELTEPADPTQALTASAPDAVALEGTTISPTT